MLLDMDVSNAAGDSGEVVDMLTLMDCLQSLGVEPVSANRFVASIVRTTQPTRIEINGRGNIVGKANGPARNLNILGDMALEL